jgi:hypothetical protein
MTSIQWGSKTLGKPAAAWCRELPAETRPAISSSTRRSLRLWLCSAPICRACNSGVPEQISVESCWKKAILSSMVTFLCGLLETRAWAAK